MLYAEKISVGSETAVLEPGTRLGLHLADESRKQEGCASVLAICPRAQDRSALRTIFNRRNWRLYEAGSYREALRLLTVDRVQIVLCARSLPDANWKDILSQIAPMTNAPRLIVMSDAADDHLRCEVVTFGGYSVLPTPLEEGSVLHAACAAWRSWQAEWERQEICIARAAGG